LARHLRPSQRDFHGSGILFLEQSHAKMSGMSTAESTAGRRWLLPHERWLGRFAGWVADPPPGGKRWAFQQNYGPEGDIFLAAATADQIAAVTFLLIGVILLGASGSKGPTAAAGYWLIAIAVFTALLGGVRALQLSHGGRAFRAGRPFIRPGQPLR